MNLILWGRLPELRDAALDALGDCTGRTLQIGCVYGDFTCRLAAHIGTRGTLDVVDVLPIQLRNLARKLAPGTRVGLLHGNSASLPIATGRYDRALLFFLLHEQPADVRRATIAEALRVVKPEGRIVIVDYHRPRRGHPLYWPMLAILRMLEPFALDIWRQDIRTWFPANQSVVCTKATTAGGLYQTLRLTR